MNQVERTLRLILCDDLQYISSDDLTAATLLSDLQIDSLDLIDVAHRIHVLLGVRISISDLRSCRTFSDLVRTVTRLVNEQGTRI